MLGLRGLWSRHKRKVFAALGVIGGGYVLYKQYDAHCRRISDMEKQLECERKTNERIKAQLQIHFENIQRISDTVTLPYALQYLKSRISEELDLSHLMGKLMHPKGHPNALSFEEKLDVWERVKELSFSKTVTSLWSMTMLCLYVRVQVNILGRHLYLETARGFGSLQYMDEHDSFNKHGQQDFLATADFLSTYGLNTLILYVQKSVLEVLREKQLKDPFSTAQLRETFTQILELFMSFGEPNHWITYIIPQNATEYRQLIAMSSNGFDASTMLMDVSKLEQLMVETRKVLSSPDFLNIAEVSLKAVVNELAEDISNQFGGIGPSGIPLAKLLPRVAQFVQPLLEEPSCNKYVHTIRALPEVQIFYTLLYSNMPQEF